jgi:signal transduction histidine kinase
MTEEGKEQRVNLVKIAYERFLLNDEAILESKRHNITTSGPSLQAPSLEVICSTFGLERVLDNLLNNATKAIPKTGGVLRLKCFQEDGMACLKLSNTGVIPPEKLEEVRRGKVKGRGLNIIQRFIQAHHGRIEVNVEGDMTIFIVRLPLAD